MLDFTSTFKISLRSLKVNKMRSILTSLGIIIGVSAVIIMLSIGEGAKQRIAKQIESTGSNLLMIAPGSTTSSGVRMGSGSQSTLTDKDAEAILKNCPSVAHVAPIVNEVKQLVYGSQNWSTAVYGITPSYMTVRLWHIEQGKGISEEDVKNSSKVVVLGSSVALNLFGDLNPINKTIRIAGMPFKVTGILETKGQSGMGHDQDDLVMIPLTTAQKKLFGVSFPGMVKFINIQAVDADSLNPAEEEIKILLRERHNLGKNKEDDFSIRNFTQMMEMAKAASNTMALLLGAIASVSLLVGGIGIMNIMLVSVTERTREIGIRMAIGAKALDIRFQFLFEALMLSLSGGFLGVLLGVGIAYLIGSFSEMSVIISAFSIVISFGFSGIIGVLFGFYPAYKASLLNPIDALRYE
ncbi:MAG: ABC transporter permease [Candidatus Gastranaerophilales bacterium]|nr:ABC transporter permease [Candidatus Gastranaerophilales bacterium]